MAQGKKKIIVYADWIETFDSLEDDEAGRLIKHFFRYINDTNPESDRLTELLFKPIKATLKRDLCKWEETQERNRQNGSKGGRPPKQIETQNNPVGFSETQNNPKKGDSVSDSVNVSVTDNVKSLSTKVNNIDSRKLKFASTLEPFLPIYGRNLLNDFYAYWTEENQSKTKFRAELEATWNVQRRLSTWAKNDRNFNPNKPKKYSPR